MRAEGAVFPPRQEGEAPLFLPSRAVASPRQASSAITPAATVTPAQALLKLKLDLVCVQEKL